VYGWAVLRRESPKHPLGLLAGHPFSSKGREKAASASGELANNFPANADLKETALHDAGEWASWGSASSPGARAVFRLFPASASRRIYGQQAIQLTKA
jgi:hypothetical protein